MYCQVVDNFLQPYAVDVITKATDSQTARFVRPSNTLPRECVNWHWLKTLGFVQEFVEYVLKGVVEKGLPYYVMRCTPSKRSSEGTTSLLKLCNHTI